VANTVADIEAVINGVADIWELDFVTTIQIPQMIVRAWVLLNEITAPGGAGVWTTYPHTTPPEARGELFALRFGSYGDSGSSSTRWYIDDVSITGMPVDAPDRLVEPELCLR